MKSSAKISILSITVLLCLYVGISTVWLMDGWGIAVRAFLYAVSGLFAVSGVLFFALKKNALLKTTLVLTVCLSFLYTTVVILNFAARLYELDTDSEKIGVVTSLIEGAGGWSMVVYVLIQILQVIFLPLPAVVCYIPGVMIWGPLKATVLASLGVLAGSFIGYFLGRVFGRKVVEWIAGKENTAKYADFIGRRGKMLFVMMQILPFFPDDIMCLVAGMTKMNFAFFSVVMIIIRPALVAAYCFLGSGSIIPFSGWGIPVWIVIAVACTALSALAFIYQDRFEKWLKNLFKKKS